MRLLGSKRIRTEAYHPSSNGLVEQFYRQLKAALKAHADPSHWSEKLPLFLFGILSALKEHLHCTAAKLVYRTTLRLPGEFFNSTDHTTLLTRLVTLPYYKCPCNSCGVHLFGSNPSANHT